MAEDNRKPKRKESSMSSLEEFGGDVPTWDERFDALFEALAKNTSDIAANAKDIAANTRNITALIQEALLVRQDIAALTSAVSTLHATVKAHAEDPNAHS
jgi:ABC-type transporter Mla subunit MlaD